MLKIDYHVLISYYLDSSLLLNFEKITSFIYRLSNNMWVLPTLSWHLLIIRSIDFFRSQIMVFEVNYAVCMVIKLFSAQACYAS